MTDDTRRARVLLRSNRPPQIVSVDFVPRGASVWLVTRKDSGEAVAVWNNESDAWVDVARRHRSHRQRYKVEGWRVGGLAQPEHTHD